MDFFFSFKYCDLTIVKETHSGCTQPMNYKMIKVCKMMSIVLSQFNCMAEFSRLIPSPIHVVYICFCTFKNKYDFYRLFAIRKDNAWTSDII